MAKEKLLLIDSDMQTLDELDKLFSRKGYEVMQARSEADAVVALELNRPELIIMDVQLDDVDGYTLLENIKKNPDWRLVPVIILSSKKKYEDKLRGLRLGVMDYLTKPYDSEELVARVRNILDLYMMKVQKKDETGPASSQERLLSFMKQRGIRTLVPRVKKQAKLGYEYPEAAKILNPEEPGGEIFFLESIARARLLERVFYDAIHICPECGHHDLNFREVCPQCSYADIAALRMITHRTCGYRGLENKFETENGKRCPRCLETLAREGVDFETSTSSLHLCAGCDTRFTEPVVNCRCMNCDQQWDVSEVLVRKIYAYKLIADTREEFLPGPPKKAMPGACEDIEKKVKELKVHFVGMDGFARQLGREIDRAKKENSGVSLLSVRFGNIECSDQKKFEQFSNHVLDGFKTLLREYDVITLKGTFEWLIMLPETPFRMAKIFAGRLRDRFVRLDDMVEVEINMASFPEDGSQARELLEVLELGIVSFQSLE
ncbi:MAG TPA: response regulator [Bacteroidetes bacterium]|nr:response regulator [Bacteroidota bacterium]